MAVDFQKTFGSNSGNVQSGAGATREDRPKATLWLNVGYDSGVEDDNGESRFVSLPTGIPLDTQEKLPANSRNVEFRAFQSARNDLLDQILAVGAKLQPGQTTNLNLQLQLRRVDGEQPEIAPNENPFVQKLQLVG